MTFTDWNKGISLTRHGCSIYCTLLSLPQNLPAIISCAWLLLLQSGVGTRAQVIPQYRRWRFTISTTVALVVTEQADCVAQLSAAPTGGSPRHSTSINVTHCFSRTCLFGKETITHILQEFEEFGGFWVWVWIWVENCNPSLQVMLQKHVYPCVCPLCLSACLKCCTFGKGHFSHWADS